MPGATSRIELVRSVLDRVDRHLDAHEPLDDEGAKLRHDAKSLRLVVAALEHAKRDERKLVNSVLALQAAVTSYIGKRPKT